MFFKFEADKTESNVVDADGPNVADADGSDGENNIIAAYNENKGITGKSRSLGNEIWNGDESTYISDSELEDDIGSCPGDSIRCVASIDIETDQSGWLNSHSSSYTIKVE